MQLMAVQAILSLADTIYLQFPYQQIQASPLRGESMGSRQYTKQGSLTRASASALELSLENTGVPMFDMAVRALARRTLMAGVFHEGMTIFEEGSRDSRTGVSQAIETATGRRWILGPADRDQFSVLPGGDVNAQMFPADPGVLSRIYERAVQVLGREGICEMDIKLGTGFLFLVLVLSTVAIAVVQVLTYVNG